MRRTILLYGVSVALLTLILKWLDYRFFIRDLSVEIYVGCIALLFTLLGIWGGSKLVHPKIITVPLQQEKVLPSVKEGISNREQEVLQLMAEGHSNREIAEKLFVSLNTVKTHSANIFSKLDVKRRTQAVKKARELNII